ncbi:BtpA/SgcQ family protein [soil metagenome]
MNGLPRFIGMVHLPPLPGSPKSSLPLLTCEESAIRDAVALADGGADGLIIENFGDAPFRPGRVDPHTVASMTRIGLRIRAEVDLGIGVNVLRNDALSALGIAHAIGASFIRVNILSGAMATDQGLITGEADQLMRLRRELGATDIKVFADVLVKHAAPLAPQSIKDAVEDMIVRGLADAVIVSGSATGKATRLSDLEQAREAADGTPVYIGSGATAESIRSLMPPAYGVIAGTSLKTRGDVHASVDTARIRAFARAVAGAAV